MEIKYKKTGATIYFSGSDGIDDTKGIIDEDKPIKLVILDELTEFFEDGEGEDELQNIEATFIRGNAAGFQMIYLYNPPKNPNAPIVEWCKKMEKRPDCVHIHTDYRDVPQEWLTIFNRFPNREEKKIIYVPHVIPHVWFHTNQKSSVGERGLSSADEYKIRIPYEECSTWLPENDFKELANSKGHWTVQNGDFFLVGNWNKGTVRGIDEIKKKFSGTVGKVLSHSENFFGSSKHIRIGGGS